MRQAEFQAEIDQIAERSYDQLDGEWLDWLDTAKRYEHKVYHQDTKDIRHDILLELNRARVRDGKPLPKLRQYRIASLTVALYWRNLVKGQTRVCLVSGIAQKQDHKTCQFSHKPSSCSKCPYRGIRPMASLDQVVTDGDDDHITIADTIATDRIEDMPDEWYELHTWLLSFPARLIQIAQKKLDGEPLNDSERQYLSRYRKQLKLL